VPSGLEKPFQASMTISIRTTSAFPAGGKATAVCTVFSLEYFSCRASQHFPQLVQFCPANIYYQEFWPSYSPVWLIRGGAQAPGPPLLNHQIVEHGANGRPAALPSAEGAWSGTDRANNAALGLVSNRPSLLYA